MSAPSAPKRCVPLSSEASVFHRILQLVSSSHNIAATVLEHGVLQRKSEFRGFLRFHRICMCGRVTMMETQLPVTTDVEHAKLVTVELAGKARVHALAAGASVVDAGVVRAPDAEPNNQPVRWA